MRSHSVMPTVVLPGGETVPALGQGTWMMATRRKKRADEIAALRLGVELGMTVIDTAEMYGDGAAEELVADALGDRRREIFLVSKVMPHHASKRGTIAACEASLRRLNTDRLDLYLLHWRGSVPLADTLASFDALLREGKIRYWGVSNFDTEDMEELVRLSGALPSPVTCNQVLYNLTRRGHRTRLASLVRAEPRPPYGLFPSRAGKARGPSRLAVTRRAAGRDARPGGARMGGAEDRGHRHSQVRPDKRRTRKPRGSRHPARHGTAERHRRGLPAPEEEGATRDDLIYHSVSHDEPTLLLSGRARRSLSPLRSRLHKNPSFRNPDRPAKTWSGCQRRPSWSRRCSIWPR